MADGMFELETRDRTSVWVNPPTDNGMDTDNYDECFIAKLDYIKSFVLFFVQFVSEI